jgi:hypothetical protein
MILLNFSHQLTNGHLAQVEAITPSKVDQVIEVNSQIDPQQPLVPRVVTMADRCGYFPAHLRLRPDVAAV